MAVRTKPVESPEKLRYYILRKPGYDMVPLIPVDQIPFQLQGIPRHLSHRQLHDEHWKLLDETSESVTVLPVQAPNNTLPVQTSTPPVCPKFRAPDYLVRREVSDVSEEPKGTRSHLATMLASTQVGCASEAVTNTRRSVVTTPCTHPQSLADSLAAIYPKDAQRIGYRPPYPSGIEPDHSRKEYCNFWIGSGECHYMAQGCKYKHVMPPLDVLRKLGFKSEPRWWKEKQALDARGLTWMQRRKNLQREDEDAADEGQTQAPQDYPADPSQASNAKLEALFSARTAAATSRNSDDEPRLPGNQSSLQCTYPIIQQPPTHVVHDLIDISTPVSPSSPQLSLCSARSTTSFASDVSSTPSLSSTARSFSPPASPRTPAPALAKKVTISKEAPKKAQPSVRRISQISWSSDNEAVQASKLNISRRKAYPKKLNNTNRQAPTGPSAAAQVPAKKSTSNSLSKSRYAITEKERPTSIANAKASQRNARLKMRNVGGGADAGGEEAPELQHQIAEHNRVLRNLRGSRGAVGGAGSAQAADAKAGASLL